MGQTPDQIEEHIETRREDLRSNFEELENKVRSATDWRQQFRNNPAAFMAVAFGGGLLLANVIGRPRGSRRYVAGQLSGRANSRSDYRRGELRQTWDNIQTALIGVAATKFKDTLADLIPGLREQIDKREQANEAGARDYASPERNNAAPRH